MTRNTKAVSFGDRSLNDSKQTLECPICGDDWLHQCGVDVYVRDEEDHERGLEAHVNHGEDQIRVGNDASGAAGNPSSRRDGIVISFWCEKCHGREPDDPLELVIQQHKGNEYIHWRVPEVSESDD